MLIDQDTKLFFSISAKPGALGSFLYNSAFRELGINAIYKPLKCDSAKAFVKLVKSLKSLGAAGVSVSMPYKKEAAEICDVLSIVAECTKNVNTIRFENKETVGYNTDYSGFIRSAYHLLEKSKSAVIYGAGAVSDSIYKGIGQQFVMHGMQDNIYIVPSDEPDLLLQLNADLFVNATPVGMHGIEDKVFTKDVVGRYKHVFDVVIKHGHTNLIEIAKNLNKDCVSGAQMYLEQLCKQFIIYTGKEPPRNLFEKLLKESGYE